MLLDGKAWTVEGHRPLSSTLRWPVESVICRKGDLSDPALPGPAGVPPKPPRHSVSRDANRDRAKEGNRGAGGEVWSSSGPGEAARESTQRHLTRVPARGPCARFVLNLFLFLFESSNPIAGSVSDCIFQRPYCIYQAIPSLHVTISTAFLSLEWLVELSSS